MFEMHARIKILKNLKNKKLKFKKKKKERTRGRNDYQIIKQINSKNNHTTLKHEIKEMESWEKQKSHKK